MKRLADAGALVAAMLCAVAQPAAAQTTTTTVETEQGELRGEVSGEVVAFKGIPFAAPPVGDLRWEPPAAPAAWEGERDATQFGPACPQAAIGEAREGRQGNPPVGATSEDCLTLNIWAPAEHDGPLPVMVWIHGGAHRIGAGSLPYYDGSAFARDGVILVTINYRLGLLGYFAHPGLTAAAGADAPLGNYGTMDQIAALQWVQKNIAGFGGDPDNVTVFGESAGGVATLMLLTIPEAEGLYDKAIVESGGGWNAMPDLAEGESISRNAQRQAGVDPDASIAELRALPPEDFEGFKAEVGFGPMVDGRLVVNSIPKAFADGRAADVPLIIGFNSDEGSLMEAFGVPSEQLLQPIPVPLQKLLMAGYGERAPDENALARRLFADGGFSAPARWVADNASDGAPSWLYRFDYVPTSRSEDRNGARHGGEIPFVFNSFAGIPWLGAMTDSDRQVADTIHGCWVSFAKTGTPTCPGAPAWPAYDAGTDTLMNFTDSAEPVRGFDARIYNLMERFLLKRALGE